MGVVIESFADAAHHRRLVRYIGCRMREQLLDVPDARLTEPRRACYA